MPQTVSRKITKKQRVLEFTAARGWVRVGECEWNELRDALPDVSAGTIQRSGLAMDAPWSGVHQHTFEELEASLREFSEIYESRPDLRPFSRQQVIAAKDRAKFLATRDATDPETRNRKAAMAEWMLIWLSDPALFPAWLSALKRPL
jgi:hypothetical protein